MILLLFLTPLQPSPWQPGEGLRLWSRPGSLSAGAGAVGGSDGGLHTGQGHPGEGTSPNRGPRGGAVVPWANGGPGVQGPTPAGSSASPATGDGTHPEERPPGRSKGGDRPRGDASRTSTGGDWSSSSLHHNHSGKGFPYSPSLFSHRISFDISPGEGCWRQG